jgi:hypothetical protein
MSLAAEWMAVVSLRAIAVPGKKSNVKRYRPEPKTRGIAPLAFVA